MKYFAMSLSPAAMKFPESLWCGAVILGVMISGVVVEQGFRLCTLLGGFEIPVQQFCCWYSAGNVLPNYWWFCKEQTFKGEAMESGEPLVWRPWNGKISKNIYSLVSDLQDLKKKIDSVFGRQPAQRVQY